jgi:hypothetical protein
MTEEERSEVSFSIFTHGRPEPGKFKGGPGLENILPKLTPKESRFYRLL